MRKYLFPGTALLIAILTFWSYVLATAYQWGYLSKFSIPAYLIEISPLRAILSLAVLSSIVFISVIISLPLSWIFKNKIHLNFIVICLCVITALWFFVFTSDLISHLAGSLLAIGVFLIQMCVLSGTEKSSYIIRSICYVTYFVFISIYAANAVGRQQAIAPNFYLTFEKDDAINVIIAANGEYFLTLTSNSSGCGYSFISFDEISNDHTIFRRIYYPEYALLQGSFCIRKRLF